MNFRMISLIKVRRLEMLKACRRCFSFNKGRRQIPCQGTPSFQGAHPLVMRMAVPHGLGHPSLGAPTERGTGGILHHKRPPRESILTLKVNIIPAFVFY